MKYAVLNGSPREGFTHALAQAFCECARAAGHEANEYHVGRMKIAGCLNCDYCRTEGNGVCIQKDDLEKIIPAYKEADTIVFASPIYFCSMTAQMHAAIQRLDHCIGKPVAKRLEIWQTPGFFGFKWFKTEIIAPNNQFEAYLKYIGVPINSSMFHYFQNKQSSELSGFFGQNLSTHMNGCGRMTFKNTKELIVYMQDIFKLRQLADSIYESTEFVWGLIEGIDSYVECADIDPESKEDVLNGINNGKSSYLFASHPLTFERFPLKSEENIELKKMLKLLSEAVICDRDDEELCQHIKQFIQNTSFYKERYS